ncbi:hypothetical protein WN943_006674 [Citrus x changshan-huyou]
MDNQTAKSGNLLVAQGKDLCNNSEIRILLSAGVRRVRRSGIKPARSSPVTRKGFLRKTRLLTLLVLCSPRGLNIRGRGDEDWGSPGKNERLPIVIKQTPLQEDEGAACPVRKLGSVSVHSKVRKPRLRRRLLRILFFHRASLRGGMNSGAIRGQRQRER